MLFADGENLSKEAEKILALFKEMPPDYSRIERAFAVYHPTDTEMNIIAILLSEDCFCEYEYKYDEELDEVVKCQRPMASDFIYQSLEFLLNHGLNPNGIQADENVMTDIQYFGFEKLAGKAMRLFMERGGNPDLVIEGESLYDSIDEWTYHVITEREDEPDGLMDTLLILSAYGGRKGDASKYFLFLNGQDVSAFKEIEKFEYEYYSTAAFDEEHKRSYHVKIIDRKTKEAVALW